MSTSVIPSELRDAIRQGKGDRFLDELVAEASNRAAFARVLKGRHPGLAVGDRVKLSALQCLGHAEGRVGIVTGHNGRNRVHVKMIRPVSSIYSTGKVGPPRKLLALCPSHFVSA